MLNYTNLNDNEFEDLCEDVMSKKLGVKLRKFAPGKDGGIDLVDSVSSKNIMVQVKHYISTSVSGLISSLKKELPKVKKQNPKQYYVCCSKELTPQNVQEIYEIFKDYMDSDANIISLIEIEEFLQKPENIDVLKKHYKLWIDSTNILQDILTNNICIDCEALMYDIEKEVKFFVKTSAYEAALNCLSNNRVLFIVGEPGVGKTTTSKMLLLNYAVEGYKIRYTTDGTDISELKKALSTNPEAKEIILLDDCFGQAYFNMKETQGKELLSLIKHVCMCKNKLLILNSRVTIYQDARNKTPKLIDSMNSGEYKLYVLNISSITSYDKAKILYNHLYFNNIDADRMSKIKENRNYMKIINHSNYNPRIIEFVCKPYRFEEIAPVNYFAYIMNNLDNPKDVWLDEYINRLSNIDRIFINTLYSLGNTTVPLELVKACFNHRLKNTPNVDFTIDHFKQCLSRLLESFVKIVDEKGKEMLSVSNPSVNDFLDRYLDDNDTEKQTIIENAFSILQYRRLLDEETFETKILEITKNKDVLKMHYQTEKQKSDYITYVVSKYQICDNEYKPYVKQYILEANDDVYIFHEKFVSWGNEIIKGLVTEKLLEFYDIKSLLLDSIVLYSFYEHFTLDSLANVIMYTVSLFEGADKDLVVGIATDAMKEEICNMCYDIPISSIDDINIGEIVDRCSYEYYDGGYIDTSLAHDTIVEMAKAWQLDGVNELISLLPIEIKIEDDFISDLYMSFTGVDDAIESYLSADGYDYEDYYGSSSYSSNYIDLLFK